MKQIKKLLIAGAAVVALTALTAVAEEKKDAPKPDKLTTCPVSGDKLGEMGKPYVFEYKGQEVKLCCKSCKKDFDKDPAKYIKKIEDASTTAPAKDAKN